MLRLALQNRINNVIDFVPDWANYLRRIEEEEEKKRGRGGAVLFAWMSLKDAFGGVCVCPK